ncbi:MAG: hypothetical protein KBT68_06970 [bacterium]|nr:hypothetical protein [Candidatus Colisoma equi]
MRNLKSCLALCAAVGLAGVSGLTFAQDDLDDLLKDLEGESAKVEAKAKTKAKAEEPEAEAKVEVATPAVAEVKAEVAAPAVAEVKAEEAAPAVAAAKAEEAAPSVAPSQEAPAASSKKVDEVMSLLDELAAENRDVPDEQQVKGVTTAPRAVAVSAAGAEAQAGEPVAKPEVKSQVAQAPASPDAELIANLRSTEKLRREALDVQAKREIAEARQSMRDEAYDEAVRHYGLALKLLNDRPSSKNLRKECDQGIAEGLYRAALQEDDLGRRDRAVKLMEKAIDMRHPKARRVLEKWNAQSDETTDKTGLADIKHRNNDAEYKTSREQIRRHLRRSRQYLAVRDMKKALEECEVVLVNDPYNQDAIRIREAIQRKRQIILQQERKAARDGMIADVDEAWRPVYAVNAAQLRDTSAETVKQQTGDDPERTMEQDIERRMKEMRLPTISFKPPATIIDAVDFFRGASKDYDRPDIPIEKRGFNFVLKTPAGAIKQQAAEEQSDDFSSNDSGEAAGSSNGLPPIPTITASDITFYEALKLVCDSVDYKFIVRGPVVMVMQKDMSTAELLSRKYDVLDAFLERMTAASSDVKEMKSAGFGGGNSKKSDEGEENQEKDWKEFFSQMGVKWPAGSSIMYIKTLGKLYVRNTRENLAEFEKVLQEMGSQPKLIEIETRFVEVSQEDLNSLGFEWILNSDYSLNLGEKLGRALGVTGSQFGKLEGSQTFSKTLSSGGNQTSFYETGDVINGKSQTGFPRTTDNEIRSSLGEFSGQDKYTRTTYPYGSQGAGMIREVGGSRNIGINAFGGTSSDYNHGNRYLSDVGNHISGENASNNDQFMRVNAFLGQADLSLILHMLSQRSDTDLLSAPKVVTKSGENAVIKVVTEYIYPQDYDVQLQSSSSGSSGGTSGGGQSAILAVVEPQNFTMREVGVILDVTPTYSEANGGTIDLELKPSVVDEPIWHNYGMRIPFTGNTSSGTMADIGNIFTGMATALTTIGAQLTPEETSQMAKTVVNSAMYSAENVSTSSGSTMTWYDAPMEQPFFHVRSIDSKVSITPGSTVVMGGLITEARKAMDDKVPFLGDLPFVGRLFRSHAEQTIKRNLLIFVTGRLITPSGRELSLNEETPETSAEVKAAPKAE